MSDRISKLIKSFDNHISLPWQKVISSEERSIFVVYNKEDELRLRARVSEFEQSAVQSGHPWQLLDITDSFAIWLGEHEYRDGYFEEPEYLAANYEYFAEELVVQLNEQISEQMDENSIVALLGCGTLFGITSVSSLVKSFATNIRGRLVVFFPGEHDDNQYRLLDATDGWGYQATSIKASD
jgi:hypothetical protein